MAYDYDKLYGETANALGEPTAIFVDFFTQYDHQDARILDVGCGQGRDALFIARLGHHVVGVDISANGIRDLKAAAARENLLIEGDVADIVHYKPKGMFDVILIDRTLHMLTIAERKSVLENLLDHVNTNGWLLIADETSNINAFENVIEAHHANWNKSFSRRGYLFMQNI